MNDLLMARYNAVSLYMNNQTDEGWCKLLRDIQILERPQEIECNTAAESNKQRSMWAEILREIASQMECVNTMVDTVKRGKNATQGTQGKKSKSRRS